MVTRKEILEEAVHKCLKDMYLWSQPSINIDYLLKSGFKDDEKNPLYRRHYLSSKNYSYLMNTYIKAYRMKDDWEKDFELIVDYLCKGGLKDKYVDDGDGHSYRSYENTLPLSAYFEQEDVDIIMSLIGDCHDFYRVNNEERSFSFTMCLGVGSPTSNKEEVEKYWQENKRPDFKIKDFYIDDVLYGTEDNEPEMTEEEFIECLK